MGGDGLGGAGQAPAQFGMRCLCFSAPCFHDGKCRVLSSRLLLVSGSCRMLIPLPHSHEPTLGIPGAIADAISARFGRQCLNCPSESLNLTHYPRNPRSRSPLLHPLQHDPHLTVVAIRELVEEREPGHPVRPSRARHALNVPQQRPWVARDVHRPVKVPQKRTRRVVQPCTPAEHQAKSRLWQESDFQLYKHLGRGSPASHRRGAGRP